MINAKDNYIAQQLLQVAPLPVDEKNFPYGFDIRSARKAVRPTSSRSPRSSSGRSKLCCGVFDELR